MMYADYTYYTDVFYGNVIDEVDYPRYATRASDFIDYMTMGKAKKNQELDAVKKCCCALAEQYSSINALRIAAAAKVTEDGIVASESVGSHSRSFRSGVDGAQAVQAAETELANIVKRYLLPTGLLYRGGVSFVHSACGNGL